MSQFVFHNDRQTYSWAVVFVKAHVNICRVRVISRRLVSQLDDYKQ
jgi:hypothetical protein